jgi:hypothetical protein
MDKEEHYLFPEKVKNNRIRNETRKKENEWAKIAKFDYEEFVHEKYEKAIEDKIRKQLLNEEL